MLTTHLHALPYTKFVLIEDSVGAKARQILDYLAKYHSNRADYRMHYFIFEQCLTRVHYPNCQQYDFTSDLRNWLCEKSDFEKILADIKDNCIIVIDSLVHLVYNYGVGNTCHILNSLINRSNVLQVITVLHLDLLMDREGILQYFEHLATLQIVLEPKRLSYTFKKGHRKIIKDIEEYHFENGRFVTQIIQKINVKQVIKDVLQPEKLATFKIELSEKDKEARDNLILPYLPRDNIASESQIQYTFEDVDDWDDEDPDDDLDI